LNHSFVVFNTVCCLDHDYERTQNHNGPVNLLFFHVLHSYLCGDLAILQIRDFHIAKREEDIGYYAGYVGEKDFYTWLVLKVFLHKDLVQAPYFWRYHSFPEGSAFMFGRALTSVLWGMIADRYGRKPVIIFGTVSVLVLL